MEIRDAADSSSLGERLWNLRNERTLCDVYLKGNESNAEEIPAHRNVLAASSPFFSGMFCSDMKESRQEHITLPEIPSAVLHLLVKYAYTSEVCVHADNVVSLLEAAIFTQLKPLAEICWNFLEEHMDRENCMVIYGLAERYQQTALTEIAKTETLRHFSTLAQSEEFRQLDKDLVMALLGSDDIIIEREDGVLDAVFSWIRYDPGRRTPLLADLLSMVRLAHVTPEHLQRSAAEFIIQMGNRGADLSDRMQQSIQVSSSVDSQPRGSCECSKGFLFFGEMVNCIDPVTGAVNILGTTPAGLSVTGNAVMGRSVFVVGSLDKHPVLFSYDLDLRTWTLQTQPHSAHLFGGVIALAGRVYALGGINDHSAAISTVECFDPQTYSWQLVADLPMPLADFGFVVHRGRLFTFGGAGHRNAKRVLRYRPTADVWTECFTMPEPREDCSCCLGDDGMIYILGGCSRYECKFSLHFEGYNPLTNQWVTRDDLPTFGRQLAVGAMDGNIYVLGASDWRTYDRATHVSPECIQIFCETTHQWSARAAQWPLTTLNTFRSSTCAVVKLKKELLRKKPCVDVDGVDEEDDADDVNEMDLETRGEGAV